MFIIRYEKESLKDYMIYQIEDGVAVFSFINDQHTYIAYPNDDSYKMKVYFKVVFYNTHKDRIIIKVLEYIKENLNNKIDKNDKNIIEERKIKKYKLIIEFMNNFNLEILKQTYYRMIYKYSDELGKNIIFCKRPSFNKYIHNSKPYYSRIEIINMARNMGIPIDLDRITDKTIEELCSKVSTNDINQHILVEHQKYIIKSNMLGLIQYYTVQGSSNINSYLRNPNFSRIKNDTYNDVIKNLWDLCLNAPPFDNEYIIYRFIHDDAFLSDLKIGDEFQDLGFMSTTRDPFYKSDVYSFGFILLKIHIEIKRSKL